MGNLFSCDNILYRILTRFSELLYLGLLWFFFSLPIITIGASTTALYYTTNKVLFQKRGKIWQNFWHAFKTNFKPATLAWFMFLCLYLLTFINFYILRATTSNKDSYTEIIIFTVILAIATGWACYVFPYIARIENTLGTTLKNAFLMSLSNFASTILLVALMVLALVISLLYLPLMFLAVSGYMWYAAWTLERIFRKYISPEELALEEARNKLDTD